MLVLIALPVLPAAWISPIVADTRDPLPRAEIACVLPNAGQTRTPEEDEPWGLKIKLAQALRHEGLVLI